jgi:hypothetical protein
VAVRVCAQPVEKEVAGKEHVHHGRREAHRAGPADYSQGMKITVFAYSVRSRESLHDPLPIPSWFPDPSR